MPPFPAINKPEGHPDDQDGKRICVHCQEWKPLEKYAKKHTTSPVRSWTCIRCTSQMARERLDEKEQVKLPSDTDTHRWCPECNQYRPLDKFSFDRAGTKRKRRCNPCRNKLRRQKYQSTMWDQTDARSLYPENTETERWCSSCERFKPFDSFYQHGRRSQRKGQYLRECKSCFGKRVEANRKLNPQWNSKLLTREEFETQLQAQDNRCYLCRREQTHKARHGAIKRLAIDHDHLTGLLRKLLCDGCNTGLGNFQDDPELLRRAADYIEAHRHE